MNNIQYMIHRLGNTGQRAYRQKKQGKKRWLDVRTALEVIAIEGRAMVPKQSHEQNIRATLKNLREQVALMESALLDIICPYKVGDIVVGRGLGVTPVEKTITGRKLIVYCDGETAWKVFYNLEGGVEQSWPRELDSLYNEKEVS
jgi:hypothetical protein